MSFLFKKFIKFGLVGFTGLIVDLSVTYIFKEWVGVDKYLANSLGFTTAMTTNFILNRIWTFKSNDTRVLRQYLKFSFIGLIGLGLTNLIIFLLHDKFDYNFWISKLIAIAVVVFWNFIGNFLFTFRDAQPEAIKLAIKNRKERILK